MRIQAGLTQVQASEKLGKPQSYVAKCELGERKVDVLELLSFCHVYNVPPQDFIARIDGLLH